MNSSRLQAPNADRAIAASPPFWEWPTGIGSNRDHFPSARIAIGGIPLVEVRQRARADVLQCARSYLGSLGMPCDEAIDVDSPLVVTGHQPELFHAGVWIKSFAAHRVAQLAGGWSIHFQADADTIKQTSIRVPTGRPGRGVFAQIAFDEWRGESPYEGRPVLDEEVFSHFGERVCEAMVSFPFRPIVEDYWSRVLSARSRTESLGERLAYGRRSMEWELGCRNLEVPLSRVCEIAAFGLLAMELLSDASRFRLTYNQILADYRKRYSVRSRNHPATDLGVDGEWIETPYWVWRDGDSQRKALWVERQSNWLVLRAEGDVIGRLGADASRGADALLGGFGGWRLRPRAIVTTLFWRLLVADWFVHGIGGGKYDEVTDTLMSDYFGVRPPGFGVITATVRLPGAESESNRTRLQTLRHRLRDMYWNPDRHLDDSLREREPLAGWIERKVELQRKSPETERDRRARFRDFRGLNDQLRPYVSDEIEAGKAELVSLRDASRGRAMYASREFAFCLHPAETVQWLAGCL